MHGLTARCIILGSLLLFVQAGLAWGQDCTTGLVAHWTFDETSGTSAADATLNGRTGTLVNMETPGDWVAGKINNALAFDGTNEMVQVTDHASLTPSTDMTLALWVNLNILASAKLEDQVFVAKLHNTAPWYTFLLYQESADNKLYFEWRNTTPTLGTTISTSTLTTGTWTHIAAVKSGSAGAIYINQTANTGSAGSYSGTIFDSDAYLGLGAYGVTQLRTNGMLDDVRFFSRALSAADIAACPTGAAVAAARKRLYVLE